MDCYLPNKANDDVREFKTAVVDVSIMNESMKSLKLKGEIECDALPPYAHNIVLRHNLNNVMISFSALSYMFADSRSTIYSYKMDGVDKDWIVPNTTREVCRIMVLSRVTTDL